MSLLPTSFPYEFQQQHPQKDQQHRISKPNSLRKANKRRMAEQDHQQPQQHFEDEQASSPRSKYALKPKFQKNQLKYKKHRSPIVSGQKLPLNRIIETLDKKSLQDLVLGLINSHPELTETVTEHSPKITVQSAQEVLGYKLQLILDNIPYKVDPSSDYSFLRVKSLVDDFFETLSDYTLNFLPPIENDLTVPLSFLFQFLIRTFSKLPKFQAVEFKYYHRLTIEKFNHIFNEVILQFLSEKKQNILIMINDHWVDHLKKVNDLNDNHFSAIYEYVREEVDQYSRSGSMYSDAANNGSTNTTASSTNLSSNSNPHDQTPDAMQQRLNSLLNFSTNNSPLHGASTLGNVYDAI
ncbi:hypothetical protein CANARDRAFT_26776 [[Candida] arabinofermentans NRRL YB-2248]|uniref:Tethering factor for nuclear proteasome STS1 n=1 Tax=[Candida] arabinofermentans NRRL YB-2248 TaxID=983967 RepID=A0A1E4T6J5_9ASCO|nr:hypothetical protein CANARDRAFT_26776 [[Candida] arabinofermentans NRRL YB-2248]